MSDTTIEGIQPSDPDCPLCEAARITPWFQMTPDLQIINPFEQQAKTAFVLGLRGKLDF